MNFTVNGSTSVSYKEGLKPESLFEMPLESMCVEMMQNALKEAKEIVEREQGKMSGFDVHFYHWCGSGDALSMRPGCNWTAYYWKDDPNGGKA
jgi:hypothetical protein